MKKIFLPFLVIFLVLCTPDRVYSLEFSITDGDCESGWLGLFSISGDINAHVAEYGYYSKSVCVSGGGNAFYSKSCGTTHFPILSFSDKGTNMIHLSPNPNEFPYKLCADKLSVSVWNNSCPGASKPIISLLNVTGGAHIGNTTAYSLKLCGVLFTNVTVGMKFKMVGNTVVVDGTENPSEGTYSENINYSYISAQNSTFITGLVSAGLFKEMGYSKENDVVDLNMTQLSSYSSYFIPFTKGNYLNIENRMDKILSGTFLTLLNPNFAYEILTEFIVRISLELEDIDLVNRLRLAPGFYELKLINEGKSGDKVRIRINTSIGG